MSTGWVILWIGLMVVTAWVVTGRFKRNAEQLSDEKPKPWTPPIGHVFEHCSRTCVVVDDGFHDGGDWRDGLLCHYSDNSGRVRELFFTPAQWMRLTAAK